MRWQFGQRSLGRPVGILMFRRHPWFLKADALRRLGLRNLATVATYRAMLRLGIHPVQRLERTIGGTRFFRAPESTGNVPAPPSHWMRDALYFGWHRQPLGDGPPDWHRNPFTGARLQGADRPWWQLSDFTTGAGDIKTVWEASRFDWVLSFAQHARMGDPAALDRLNPWLHDWCTQNPAYRGPNWKCGQEASIRVLHLALAAQMLRQLHDPEPDLVRLVEAHLARIHPTLAYAMAQDNNHGTSEAAALFVGGSWLASVGDADGALEVPRLPASLRAGKPGQWAEAGRKWLENRAARLIEPDGGFSQHSVNYHRLMLDTLCMAELSRQWFDLTAFSDRFYSRCLAATNWLHAMVDPETGDAPNLGANDGANLLPLTDACYRDYRPTVQLATVLFGEERAYGSGGPHDDHLASLGLDSHAVGRPAQESGVTVAPNADSRAARTPTKDQAESFHAKGYIVLRNGPWKALFRYPHYRFRPGHCDALHVDLWHGSENLLRDAGSYGYNAEPGMAEYFTGPAGHNTVQFDDRDPMPRVSRFLRGAWLKTESQCVLTEERDGVLLAAASYRDWLGARHQRELALEGSGLRVVDEVSGFQSRAVLRWRLPPGDWVIEGYTVRCARPAHVENLSSPARNRSEAIQAVADVPEAELPRTENVLVPPPGSISTASLPVLALHALTVQSSVPIQALRIVPGWESRHYLQKNPISVLEVEILKAGRVISEYRLEL